MPDAPEALLDARGEVIRFTPDQTKAAFAGNDAPLDYAITIAAALAVKPVPPRAWAVPGWIPRRQVTLLSGNGGDGKSLISIQLMVAASLGGKWLGIPVAQRFRCFGIFAEDDEDEMHARLIDIAAIEGVDIATLSDMAWRSAVIDPCELVEINQRGKMQPTPYFEWLKRSIKEFGARVVILDAAANLFGGDEIVRRQVNGFLTMLRHLAIEIDGAIILLAHPSVAGMNSGSGYSGSTGWNNGVRSRLYLEQEAGEGADKDVRILSKKKSNYGTIGDSLRIRWTQGAFVAFDGPTNLDRVATNAKAERVFLSLLARTYEIGSWVSATPSARNYAPKAFASHPDHEAVGKASFAHAMNRLVKDGKIEVDKYDRPSAPRYRLRVK